MLPDTLNSGFLLRTLMDTLSDAIYFKDLQSRFIMVNQSCFEKHGWASAEAVKGRTDFDVFSKEHAEQAFADEQRIIETGEPLDSIEEKETWPDGSATWVSTTKMPLKNRDGKIIGTFGISRDITKRKEAELRAQRYAAEMREILEEIKDDMAMAGGLQKAFFSSNYPVFPSGAASEERCVEFLHHFTLCSKVTGDFCSIHRLSATKVGIFQCDVSGLGVRSALGTALIRSIVQEIAPLGLEPGAYLSRMNELLVPLLRHDQMLLDISACYLVLDLSTGKVCLASASHPLPICVSQRNGARWLCENREFRGPALAVENDISYPTIECTVCPGDSVVLYTDGLYTVENRVGDPYGEKRLLDSAQSLVGDPLAEVFQSLEADAVAFAHHNTFTDDVCLVGFQLRYLLH